MSTTSPMNAAPRLALFDLDNTLLTGDSEVLWVEYLLARGEVAGDFAARNAEMDRRYTAGIATPAEFCAFYASTFAGRTPGDWAPVRRGFFDTVIAPRLPASAHALVRQHRERGDVLVLTTAATRFLSEPTAAALGFEHLVATELVTEQGDAGGSFTGANRGTLNMREGKVTRLLDWLGRRGSASVMNDLAGATFYSDSINDLPLLLAVGHPVAVDPDPRLLAEAEARGWPVLRLDRALPLSDHPAIFHP